MEKSPEELFAQLDPHLQKVLRSHLPVKKTEKELEHPPMEDIGRNDEHPNTRSPRPVKNWKTNAMITAEKFE